MQIDVSPGQFEKANGTTRKSWEPDSKVTVEMAQPAKQPADHDAVVLAIRTAESVPKYCFSEISLESIKRCPQIVK
jgi:hypothetical protein